MKYKRKKATFGVLAPNIQRGGMAIPLGNNLYWMKGRKHKTGGIDIGKDLEVENNEVMQMLPNETRVFSSVKMLGGNSPAELVASGLNPDAVFAMQEQYKKVNRIKDDGTKYKRGGKYEKWKEEHPVLDAVTDFLPIVSTVKDGIELYEKPSWSNAGWFTLDLASDILTAGAGKAIVGAAKGAAKTLKAASKSRKVSQRTRTMIDAATSKNVNLGNVIEGGEQVEKFVKKAGLVGTDLYQNHVQHTIQEKENKVSKKLDKYGGKAKLGKRIKGAEENGSRDIYYDDKQHRWVFGSNRQVLPLGHRVKLNDGYEYQLNSDGSRTRIGKKPNAYERMITFPMQYTPNNDKVEAIGDVLTAPFVDQGETYYNGILPLRNGSQFKDAPLYAYRTGDMSYLKNDDNYIRTIDRTNNPALPRKLYTFYNQDTLYLPSTLIQNLDRLKNGIGMNQENVNRDYIYGAEYKPIIDARNHHMQIRQLDNRKYVADFSDVFDVNDEFFDSKANPIVFSQYGVPVEFTGDSTKWNDSFVSELNKALSKKYGGKMNLQNSINNSLTSNKRMISPNKLGTIVRVDGNGRDRLAYIPSTGSSQQDMKCGGRVKAETGLSWGYYPPRDGLLFGEDIDYNIGRDNTSYRVPLFASNDNRITGLRLPTLGYLRPSDTFLANWMASANANNRNGVINTQESYGYTPRYSHLRLDTGSGNNNTNGSWSQFLTNLDTPTLIDKRTHKTDGANVYSTKKSDSVSPQSTNKKGISSYLDIVNDITKGESDWQGYAAAGVNALGSVINSLIMNNALRKQRPPVRPVPKIAQKLKTKYNINPQLSENREATAQAVKDVVRNTASSQVGRNLVNNLGLQRAIADNKLFAEKENKETELINKDIINRQSVDHENVDTYNKWLEARNDFYNNRSLLRAQNWATLVNGISSQIGAGLGNIGASRRYRNNVLLAMLPYIKATGNG